MLDIMSYILGQKSAAGGGGSDVTIEQLSVEANGAYTADEGKAFNPVVVNVSGKSGTLTFAENTTFNDYTLDVGSDFDYFVIYATTKPLNIVGGRTACGLFKNFAANTENLGLYVVSNAGGGAYAGSMSNMPQATKSGSVITFHTTDGAKFATGITYQWYAW